MRLTSMHRPRTVRQPDRSRLQRMNGRRLRWLTGSVALGAALLACEPTPRYAQVEQPTVGTILAEMSTVVTETAERIDLAGDPVTGQARLRVLIPAGAYAVGTKVTARLVHELPQRLTTCSVLSGLKEYWGPGNYLALQILPAQMTPALPLRVELTAELPLWGYAVLHALESSSAWTVGDAPELTSDGVAFAVFAPGLWTVAQLPMPPSLQGTFQRVEVRCDGRPFENPPAWYLDIAGDAAVLATPSKYAGCYDVHAVTVGMRCGQGTWEDNALRLQSAGGYEMARAYDYALDPTGSGFWWRFQTDSALPNDCGIGQEKRDHFVLLPPGSEPPPWPQVTSAGCPADQGGGPDGGRD
jgi:hypothetical protein